MGQYHKRNVLNYVYCTYHPACADIHTTCTTVGGVTSRITPFHGMVPRQRSYTTKHKKEAGYVDSNPPAQSSYSLLQIAYTGHNICVP